MWFEQSWRNEILQSQSAELFRAALEEETSLLSWESSFQWKASVSRGSLIFDILIFGPAVLGFLAAYPKASDGVIRLVNDLSYLAKKSYYLARLSARLAVRVAKRATGKAKQESVPAPKLAPAKPVSTTAAKTQVAKTPAAKTRTPRYLTIGTRKGS
jgi:hypothetical protein